MKNTNKTLKSLSLCTKENENNVKRPQNEVLKKMAELGTEETNEVLDASLNHNSLNLLKEMPRVKPPKQKK